MTITREDVADLREGDVVEMRDDYWPDAVVRGPLVERSWGLSIGDYVSVRRNGTGLPDRPERRHLTVVSRALRPLYVNHARTEPVPGDVVRDADDEVDRCTWTYFSGGPLHWRRAVTRDQRSGVVVNARDHREVLPARLRLLVDGETGWCVP